MLNPLWGVTRAWYEQFSRRRLFHYASFWGELRVVFSKLGARCRCCGLGPTAEILRLSCLRRSSLGTMQTLRKRRAEVAAAKGIDVTMCVVDGQQKLTRRVCAVPRVSLWPAHHL
eukprot:1819903-Amphidinium_carterae.1